MLKLPIQNYQPDIKGFVEVMTGKKKENRVRFGELFLDTEVTAKIFELTTGEKWVPLNADRAKFWDNYAATYKSLGYDYIKPFGGMLFPKKVRETDDTSAFSKGTRQWVETGTGIINTWEDFEKYPWPKLSDIDLFAYEYTSKNVPDGMGLMPSPTPGFLEVVSETLIGFEGLSYMLYDDEELVKAVFDKVGELIYGFYEKLIGLPNLAGFFVGDDMGYKSATMFSPAMYREYLFPWHKKLADLAHKNGYIYMLHSCGQLEAIMDDLIDDVKIDVKHSYEDAIIPVTEFYKKYSSRIGIMGGVDVDMLCRGTKTEITNYVENILDVCHKGGRYALGSGNSIANYIPLENYLLMLEIGANYAK